ncbi:pyridoxamine 5'-phosphate oxidase family protein [Rhizohabitans arisaemae]|uniref:pyridoxamine 5'-phosphate oxidase family protein n=1 Tax=Rhizohabitans arisaemae TaxID=2720610 RepID=UPI0024B1FBB4|nr:pyridoxamine 5'-phosphate oxidase family protein [Rhizohabitans arisaemae]
MTERVKVSGDLGRRVAARREELSLSREQLAARAGLDPGYLDHLEETGGAPAIDVVHKLAVALNMGVEELLRDTPGGRLEKLEPDECLRLIAPGGIGRVAFNEPAGPAVLPVNYMLHNGAIIIRTAIGGPLDEPLRTGMDGAEFKIAFQVDRIDETTREGWSVLVRGGVHHVSPDERAAAAASGVQPWAGGPRELYLRIATTEITGRRIRRG